MQRNIHEPVGGQNRNDPARSENGLSSFAKSKAYDDPVKSHVTNISDAPRLSASEESDGISGWEGATLQNLCQF